MNSESRARVAIAAIAIAIGGGTPAASAAASNPCRAPAFRQFDFWLGDWDAFEIGRAKPEARNRVTSLLDGCAVQEDYRGADGFAGRSFSFFDARRHAWHQTWVTSRGTSLQLDGGMVAGAMVLTGPLSGPPLPSLIRGVWRRDRGDVRETATTSTDGGRTWRPLFDIVFRSHGGG